MNDQNIEQVHGNPVVLAFKDKTEVRVAVGSEAVSVTDNHTGTVTTLIYGEGEPPYLKIVIPNEGLSLSSSPNLPGILSHTNGEVSWQQLLQDPNYVGYDHRILTGLKRAVGALQAVSTLPSTTATARRAISEVLAYITGPVEADQRRRRPTGEDNREKLIPQLDVLTMYPTSLAEALRQRLVPVDLKEMVIQHLFDSTETYDFTAVGVAIFNAPPAGGCVRIGFQAFNYLGESSTEKKASHQVVVQRMDDSYIDPSKFPSGLSPGQRVDKNSLVVTDGDRWHFFKPQGGDEATWIVGDWTHIYSIRTNFSQWTNVTFPLMVATEISPGIYAIVTRYPFRAIDVTYTRNLISPKGSGHPNPTSRLPLK